MDLEQRKGLIEKITEAFADTPYPQNGYIGRAMQDDFGGKHWQDVANVVELLLRWRDDLYDLSFEGLRYFLPAFLIAIIRIPDKVDTLVDTIIGVLAPPDVAWEANLQYQARQGNVPDEKIDQTIENLKRNDWDHWKQKLDQFNQPQRVAIHEFLCAYKDLAPYSYNIGSERLELAILFWAEVAENDK
jgi:hypothetical protein